MTIKIDGKKYGLIPLEEETGRWEPFGATGMFAGTITPEEIEYIRTMRKRTTFGEEVDW